MSTTREEALTIVQHAQPNEIFIQHLKDGRTRIDIAAHKEVKRGKWAQVADTFTVKRMFPNQPSKISMLIC